MENKKYKCAYCGRCFIKPVPHKCNGSFRKRRLVFNADISSQIDWLVMPKTADGWKRVWELLPTIGKPVIVKTHYGKYDICYLRIEENNRLLWVNDMRPQHTNGSVIEWKEIE